MTFCRTVLSLAVLLLATAMPALAQTETVLYSFGAQGHGKSPSSMIFNRVGGLVGLTFGGKQQYAIFELSPSVGGGWTETLPYVFKTVGSPNNLIIDKKGNLYGTSYVPAGVFELTRTDSGTWDESLIYTFSGSNVGVSSLILDSSGNLFGTTLFGGANNTGQVFELTRGSHTWNEATLYTFGPAGNGDGDAPESLIMDAQGNLYGTTVIGGNFNGGTVFELTLAVGGGWNETVLYSFPGGTAGGMPTPGLARDNAGNLYGSTAFGGDGATGMSFELSPVTGGGNWAETVLHTFTGGADGSQPGRLTLDAQGNLYGEATNGGGFAQGTVFEISQASGGGWTLTVLHNFAGGTTDGSLPNWGLILDSNGNLYGTTETGGGLGGCIVGSTYYCGTAFEITP